MTRIKVIFAIALAVFGLVAVFITGRRGGYKKGQLEGIEREEDLLNEVADKKLEAKRNKPIVNRINDTRDRILQRRREGG